MNNDQPKPNLAKFAPPVLTVERVMKRDSEFGLPVLGYLPAMVCSYQFHYDNNDPKISTAVLQVARKTTRI